ncbi:hypothetical protein CHELA1G11_11742 [Hyphomicrobiales bacterium]|nr:hypothetical protein CHELA1G11_11742 [Hyphomicrobiales bacterium]CAH1665674.1 hypothetical protein CHELA1G2_12564 [Hyphomicrobiales bacterium]
MSGISQLGRNISRAGEEPAASLASTTPAPSTQGGAGRLVGTVACPNATETLALAGLAP